MGGWLIGKSAGRLKLVCLILGVSWFLRARSNVYTSGLHLFTPRLRSHGHFVGYSDHGQGRTLLRLTQTRRRSPRVGPTWGRTSFLIRHAPGPDWYRNCSTGAWNCQSR